MKGREQWRERESIVTEDRGGAMQAVRRVCIGVRRMACPVLLQLSVKKKGQRGHIMASLGCHAAGDRFNLVGSWNPTKAFVSTRVICANWCFQMIVLAAAKRQIPKESLNAKCK